MKLVGRTFAADGRVVLGGGRYPAGASLPLDPTMTPAHRLAHMIAAAEAWASAQAGQPMRALVQTAQDDDGAGTLSLVVQLYHTRSVPHTAAQPEPVGCVVTLAPDGQLACRSEDDGARQPVPARQARREGRRWEGMRGMFRALASFGG